MPHEAEHPSSATRARPSSPLAIYLQALRDARWVLIGGSLLAGVVAYGICLVLQPRFEASAVIMVTAAKTGEQVAAPLDTRNFRAFIQNQSLAAGVVKDFGLDMSPQRFLEKSVNVQDVRGTDLLTLSVTLNDPKLAARVANDIAARAVTLSRSVEQAEAVVARDVIKGQLDAARERLTQTRASLESYQREAQIELLEKKMDVLIDQQADVQQLTVNIEGLRAYVIQAERDLAQQDRIRGVQRSVQLATPPRTALEDPPEGPPQPGPFERAATRARETKDDDREQRLTGRPPDPRERKTDGQTARGAAAEVTNETRADADRNAPATPPALRDALVDPYINPSYEVLQQAVTTARARLAQLEHRRTEILKSRAGSGQIPALADFYTRKARVDELRMQEELSEKIYVDVATRFEQARLQIASRSAQLQLVDPALPPDRKVYPREKLIASAAVVLAFSLLSAGVLAMAAISLELSRGEQAGA